MNKKESALQKSKIKVERLTKEINRYIEELGEQTEILVDYLTAIQNIFDSIRGWSSDQELRLNKLKLERLNWLQQVEKIAADYRLAEIKSIGGGVAGAGTGVAVIALGPTALMGVSTTFGVASTGTAISALSGAAATNAALAWLGGGALAAGGSGIAGGTFFLFLTGPVGWIVGGGALLTSGAVMITGRNDRQKLEKIYTAISDREIKSYQLSILEIKERIQCINEESELLEQAIITAANYGNDYGSMTEEQQVNLITFVNLMNSSTQLLINPILGLQPKIFKKDIVEYLQENSSENENKQQLYVELANLLYGIKLNDKEKKLLRKNLVKNKDFMEKLGLSKKDFDLTDMSVVEEIWEYKCS